MTHFHDIYGKKIETKQKISVAAKCKRNESILPQMNARETRHARSQKWRSD